MIRPLNHALVTQIGDDLGLSGRGFRMQQMNWGLKDSIEHIRSEWRAHIDAGDLAFERGLFLAAVRNYRKAIAIAQSADLGDECHSCTSLKIAKCYLKLGLLREAETYFKEVLTLDQKSYHAHGTDLAVDMSEAAMLYLKMGRLSAAEDLLLRSVKILEHLSPQTKPLLAKSLKNLGIVECEIGHLCDAGQCLNRAICLCSGFKNDDRLYAMILAAMASLALAKEEPSEAKDLIIEAIKKLEMATGGEHPDLAKLLDQAAVVMKQNGLFDEEKQYSARAKSIRKHVRNIDS